MPALSFGVSARTIHRLRIKKRPPSTSLSSKGPDSVGRQRPPVGRNHEPRRGGWSTGGTLHGTSQSISRRDHFRYPTVWTVRHSARNRCTSHTPLSLPIDPIGRRPGTVRSHIKFPPVFRPRRMLFSGLAATVSRRRGAVEPAQRPHPDRLARVWPVPAPATGGAQRGPTLRTNQEKA